MGKKKKRYRYILLSVTASILLILIFAIITLKPNKIEKVNNEPINRVVVNDSIEINKSKRLLVNNEDKNVSTKEATMTKDDNLRKDKSNDSDVVTTLLKDSTVTILNEYDDGWCKVKYEKYEGYIMSESIKIS